jgi:hypothetical protein
MNQQMQIKPWEGLKDVLLRKNLKISIPIDGEVPLGGAGKNLISKIKIGLEQKG